MPKIENTVVIDRPVEAVWKYYTDLSNIPTLDPEIREARQTPPGSFGIGSTFSLKGKDWVMMMRVTQFEPNRKLVYECVSPDSLKGSTDSYSLESVEGKTRFVETMDVKGSGIYRLASSFFGKRAKEDSSTRLDNLKHKLESQ